MERTAYRIIALLLINSATFKMTISLLSSDLATSALELKIMINRIRPKVVSVSRPQIKYAKLKETTLLIIQIASSVPLRI